MIQGGLRGTPRAAPETIPDSAVTAAMQAAIAREMPSWRGIIAETGGLPNVSANGPILYVATTLASSEVDGVNDLCEAVSIWAKAAAPPISHIRVVRGQRELASCRVL